MGKPDPLELYHAVMGEMWEEEHRRAGAARDRAAARQPRSYKRTGWPSVRNIAKASQGSRSAVFKRIRAGGCKTRQSLGNQLDYVNDKAVCTFSSMTNALSEGATLTGAQKEQIIKQWAGTWVGTSKLGFTSHMLLSFPTDVSAEQVQGIALDWCEHFFESGYYGDEWDYVVAVHTDRDHPHAHILLNNRGKDQGVWFACWADGVMSPQLMREKQAEIAEAYGVALDATTRLERGIFAHPAGLEEIYAAKAEGRSAREVALTDPEAALAEAAVIAFAKEYRDVADVLDQADKSHMASSVRLMAGSLAEGNAWHINQGDLDMVEIRSVGDAIEYAETRIEEIQEWAGEMEQPERTAFELRAAPVIASLSKMVPDPELRISYNQELVEPYPPGSGANDLVGIFENADRGSELGQILQGGTALGLDTDDALARLETGGTKNYGLAQDWVDRDLSAILAKDGIELEEASSQQLGGALDRLDGFQMRLASELGVEVTSAFTVLEQRDRERNQELAQRGDAQDGSPAETVRADGTQRAEDQGIAGTGSTTNARGALQLEESDTPNAYIRQLAQELQDGDLTSKQEDTLQRALVAELHKVLGDDGLAALDRGHWEVLDDVASSKVDQIDVTQTYLEVAAEDRGAPELAEIASGLQQVRATERAKEISAEMAHGGGLDDDLGL
jgi:type IV secretion system T-DNA border endonuclease VirD2